MFILQACTFSLKWKRMYRLNTVKWFLHSCENAAPWWQNVTLTRMSRHTQTKFTVKAMFCFPLKQLMIWVYCFNKYWNWLQISQNVWHLIKIHFPLLGSSILYKQKNLIKAKLNITQFIWGKHLSTRVLCPGISTVIRSKTKQTTFLLDCPLMTNIENNTLMMREFKYLLIYTLSMPSSSGVGMLSSCNVGCSSWIRYG